MVKMQDFESEKNISFSTFKKYPTGLFYALKSKKVFLIKNQELPLKKSLSFWLFYSKYLQPCQLQNHYQKLLMKYWRN